MRLINEFYRLQAIEKIAKVILKRLAFEPALNKDICEEVAEAILNLLKEQGWREPVVQVYGDKTIHYVNGKLIEPVVVENLKELLLTLEEQNLIIKRQGRCKFWQDDDCPLVIGGVSNTAKDQLNKALTARRPCEDCGGSKVVEGIDEDTEKPVGMICPTCKGTGLSPNKVFVVLCENQELPFIPYDPSIEVESYQVARETQQDMINDVWRKVKV